MPNFQSLRHVIKNSMGITYCIWYKNGLYMSMLENNRWGPPFLLSDIATPDFSAVLNAEDSICGAFVDYSGRLLYIMACEERKEPMVLLESRIEGSAPYNICIMDAKEQSHIFYMVSHNRKHILTYQRVDGAEYTIPEVMGVVIKESRNFSACSDGNSIHLFFLTDIQDVCLIVHRRITPEGKAQKPNSSPFPFKAAKKLQSLMSKDGSIYVLASGEENQDSALLFRFDSIGCKFSKGLEVFGPSSPEGYDSLILINNMPSVIRTCRNQFILSRIKPDASEIIEEIKIDFIGNDSMLRCRYQSNAREDYGFKGSEIPVIFEKGLRFPFDWKTLAGNRFDKVQDDKACLQDLIKELEGRVTFLENTIREMLRP